MFLAGGEEEKQVLEEKTGYFPLFVDLQDKKIVVVGGGKIATRRIQVLVQFSCHILVIALELTDELQLLEKSGQIQVRCREPEEEDFDKAFLVIAATNDREVNDQIVKRCKDYCFVNHVGDKKQSSFYFPGIVKEDHYVIGATASGENHRQAKRITDFLREKWKEFEL